MHLLIWTVLNGTTLVSSVCPLPACLPAGYKPATVLRRMGFSDLSGRCGIALLSSRALMLWGDRRTQNHSPSLPVQSLRLIPAGPSIKAPHSQPAGCSALSPCAAQHLLVFSGLQGCASSDVQARITSMRAAPSDCHKTKLGSVLKDFAYSCACLCSISCLRWLSSEGKRPSMGREHEDCGLSAGQPPGERGRSARISLPSPGFGPVSTPWVIERTPCNAQALATDPCISLYGRG